MVYTKVVSNKSPWLQKAQLGGVYCNPASHGEGRFVANEEWLQKLFANGQVATQYVTPDGQLSVDEEWNVNGSYMNIEGITSPDGRILGKMAHSERRGDGVAINIYGEQDIKIGFSSNVCKRNTAIYFVYCRTQKRRKTLMENLVKKAKSGDSVHLHSSSDEYPEHV